jgi:hypothetical protein
VRSVRVVPLLALALAALTGCAPFGGFACTAVGYSTTAHITLAEPRSGIDLQLCDGAGCAPRPGMTAENPPLEQATPSDLSGASAPTPVPPAPMDTAAMSITGDSMTGWSAELLGGQPVLGYRLTDAAGAVVSEGEVEADWVRVGGSAECGGPREAKVQLPG